MPHLRIETNVPANQIPAGLGKDLSQLVAKILQKPEAYVCVTIIGGVSMLFGGSDAPCATTTLMSIGRLGEKENISHSKALFAKICSELRIDPSRMYITFADEKSGDIGYNSTTLFEIFGK